MSDAVPAFLTPDSEGWLVLSNRIPRLGNETPMLMERMLALVDLSYPPLCLTLGSISSADMDDFLDDYKTLTGIDVTIIDLWDLNYQETIAAVSKAGFVILAGGLALDWVMQIDPEGLGNSASDFLQKDRLIMAIGMITASLGSWVYSPEEGDTKPGLNWIPDAIVLPDQDAPMQDENVRAWLTEHGRAYAIGLSHDAIFALGSQGKVEVWSTAQPVIALGKGWSAA
jgi:hypothetical protein